jgi:hypothetical protein
MSGQHHDCQRTRVLRGRLLAGSVNDDDRRHAGTCPACGPLLARAARFDDELERSARRLTAEDMPGGILDPDLVGQVHLGPRLRSLAPSATAGFAAIALVVIATIVGIRPVLLPGGSPNLPLAQDGPRVSAPAAEALWSLDDLTGALTESFHYKCGAGGAPATPAPGAATGESAICVAPSDAGPFTAAVTLDASEQGTVVRVTIAADIVGAPTQRARDAVATALARVTAAAFTGQGPAIRAANFVFAKASQLSGPAWALGIDEGGVRVALQRLADGGYIVSLSVTS